MRRITTVVHTHNDGLRLGRCLETVYPCDEILVVDHGSSDDTLSVAREYGARIVVLKAGASIYDSVEMPKQGWILCLDPRESLTEALSASLYEWKMGAQPEDLSGLSVMLREETVKGWIEHPAAQTRLVPIHWQQWNGKLPGYDPAARVLQGEVLRFSFP